MNLSNQKYESFKPEIGIFQTRIEIFLNEGGLAWAVVRYLARPGIRQNKMPVENTARASLR